MLRMKDTNKLIKNILRALPAIPRIRAKRPSVVPYILGAVGLAIVGGITAVMILSPRTRSRTLGIAKDSYGKVRGQLGQLGIGERLGLSHGDRGTMPDAYSNGLDVEGKSSGRGMNATY
jgi:hypothetical protein